MRVGGGGGCGGVFFSGEDCREPGADEVLDEEEDEGAQAGSTTKATGSGRQKEERLERPPPGTGLDRRLGRWAGEWRGEDSGVVWALQCGGVSDEYVDKEERLEREPQELLRLLLDWQPPTGAGGQAEWISLELDRQPGASVAPKE